MYMYMTCTGTPVISKSSGPKICHTGCPKKAERLIFVTLIFENIEFFSFHQIKHCLLKRMIPRSLKLIE